MVTGASAGVGRATARAFAEQGVQIGLLARGETGLEGARQDQFEWLKNRLPNKPQPVPPIYQPEVAARAIVWAAEHDRNELWVGWPTVKAIIGNRVVPRWLDRRLAQSGYESQQTDEPEDDTREHNLWSPVQGDYGAHGRFDEQARTWSSQFWMTTHRRIVALIGIAISGLIGIIAAKWRTQGK